MDNWTLKPETKSIVVDGWAIDQHTRQPVKHIVAMNGDDMIASWSTGTLRADLSDLFGKDAGYAGFYSIVPEDRVLENKGLRVFAINHDGQYNELNYSENAIEFFRVNA